MSSLSFQSPYGGIGASDDDIIDDYKKISSFNHLAVAGVGLTGLPFLISHISESFMFQSPYGGRGRSDKNMDDVATKAIEFQSPYGGRGRSDRRS